MKLAAAFRRRTLRNASGKKKPKKKTYPGTYKHIQQVEAPIRNAENTCWMLSLNNKNLPVANLRAFRMPRPHPPGGSPNALRRCSSNRSRPQKKPVPKKANRDSGARLSHLFKPSPNSPLCGLSASDARRAESQLSFPLGGLAPIRWFGDGLSH